MVWREIQHRRAAGVAGLSVCEATTVCVPSPSPDSVSVQTLEPLVETNDQTNGVAIWPMDGSTVTANPQIGTAPAGTHLVALGDYNADGKTDLIFGNDTTHALTS